MALLRGLGRLFLLIAVVFAGNGLYVWLSGNGGKPAGVVWFEQHHTSLNNAEVIVSRYLMVPGVWRDAVLPYLQRPAWEASLWGVIVCLIIGGLFVYLGRRRRRRGGLKQH
ncbi:hypothetical protein HH303_05235 [Rhodospirillaceae bacterium KN72]|uniref:Uncharacterized protein n=1 Tax=Pacificispira spongiicola TaxID=2729598 RepID=A0A7Y0DYD3_9PROT|nr:hypothetical protein [Pacificispira spongiicola]NMM43870.1 hypothetical protein [Pacificispira spongiicola]